MTMKKILFAGACAGLLALTAAPVLAAGPMISGTTGQTVNGGAVQNVEYRWNEGHRDWRPAQHPPSYAPAWGHRGYAPAWGHHGYAPAWGHSNWGNYHHDYWRYHHHPGYWRW